MTHEPTDRGTALLAVGVPLGLLFGAVALVRRAKPLHPKGVLRPGVLEITQAQEPTGVPLLDAVGRHPCVVRTSRATGLPAPLPDIHGVAVRLQLDGQVADLLFAGTGTGTWGRHVLVPRTAAGRGAATTLIPARSPRGPLLLGLFPDRGVDEQDPRGFSVRICRPGGPWHERGHLTLLAQRPGETDPPLRFDTVTHPVPGLDHYPAVRSLREPSYALARRGWPVEAVDTEQRVSM